MKIELESIGTVRDARRDLEDDFWGGAESVIEIDERLDAGVLQGLEDFSHVEVIFLFHRVDPAKVVQGARRPRNDPQWPEVGILAQRGKNRPNRIGSTVCRIVGREGRRLRVAELDAVEGTPVLDLKPVMREFLPRGALRQPAWAAELMRDYWSPHDTARD